MTGSFSRPALADAMKPLLGLQALEDEVTAHVRKHFSQDLRLLDAEQVARLVRLGILRAAWHGITKKGAMCQYVDLMVALGSELDEDPQLGWIRDIAARKSQGIAGGMGEIAREAVKYTLAVRGRDGELFTRALSQARMLAYVDVNQVDPDTKAVAPILKRVHPEKLEKLGNGLEDFVFLARERARALGLGEQGCVYTVMAFLLGWRLEDSPMFPWARAALGLSSQGKVPSKPTNKSLYDAGVAELNRALSPRALIEAG